MSKDDFMALGFTDEQATKASEASKKELEAYIPKTRFDEVNNAKKKAEEDVTSRDKQIDELKKSVGDNEDLKKQIETLQTDNKSKDEKYQSDLKELSLTNAIKLAVTGKVHDEDMVAGLFDKSKLILGEDGKITGLDEQLKGIQDSKAFLFKQDETKPGFGAFGGSSESGNGNPPTDINAQLAGAFGVKL